MVMFVDVFGMFSEIFSGYIGRKLLGLLSKICNNY